MNEIEYVKKQLMRLECLIAGIDGYSENTARQRRGLNIVNDIQKLLSKIEAAIDEGGGAGLTEGKERTEVNREGSTV